jgi:hypothetical protein
MSKNRNLLRLIVVVEAGDDVESEMDGERVWPPFSEVIVLSVA